jgi:hypothetical protein
MYLYIIHNGLKLLKIRFHTLQLWTVRSMCSASVGRDTYSMLCRNLALTVTTAWLHCMCLSAAKFKPLAFSVLALAMPVGTNLSILAVFYDFCLLLHNFLIIHTFAEFWKPRVVVDFQVKGWRCTSRFSAWQVRNFDFGSCIHRKADTLFERRTERGITNKCQAILQCAIYICRLTPEGKSHRQPSSRSHISVREGDWRVARTVSFSAKCSHKICG